MQEQNMLTYEDCKLYAGNLNEETSYLMQEQSSTRTYTNNTIFLTIFCC